MSEKRALLRPSHRRLIVKRSTDYSCMYCVPIQFLSSVQRCGSAFVGRTNVALPSRAKRRVALLVVERVRKSSRVESIPFISEAHIGAIKEVSYNVHPPRERSYWKAGNFIKTAQWKPAREAKGPIVSRKLQQSLLTD